MKNSLVLKSIKYIALIYTLALTVGSLIRPIELNVDVIIGIDKILHFVAYFGLALLWLSYYHLINQDSGLVWKPKHNYIVLAIILIIYGIIIELLQGGVTNYRSADVWDALANTIGIVLGSIVFVLFFKNFKRLKSIN